MSETDRRRRAAEALAEPTVPADPSCQGAPSTQAAPRARRLGRRQAIASLGGLGVASLAVMLVGPTRRLLAEPDRSYPDWVYTMPRGGEAYSAAYANLELMATIPCFCGCMSFENPHRSVYDCFVSPSGEIDPHGAFCETCQDEAIEALALHNQGVSWPEIHSQIVAKYADRDPSSGGGGCGGDPHAEGAACTP